MLDTMLHAWLMTMLLPETLASAGLNALVEEIARFGTMMVVIADCEQIPMEALREHQAPLEVLEIATFRHVSQEQHFILDAW